MLNRIWKRKTLNPKQHFFFLEKRKPVLKEKTMEIFLVKVFTEGKKVVGKAFFLKKGLFLSFRFRYCLVFRISNLGFNFNKVLNDYGGGDD